MVILAIAARLVARLQPLVLDRHRHFRCEACDHVAERTGVAQPSGRTRPIGPAVERHAAVQRHARRRAQPRFDPPAFGAAGLPHARSVGIELVGCKHLAGQAHAAAPYQEVERPSRGRTERAGLLDPSVVARSAQVRLAAGILVAAIEPDMPLEGWPLRTLTGTGRGREHVGAGRVTGHRRDDAGLDGHAAHALFHAHLRRAQVEIARAKELRKREGRQRRGIARREQHVVLPHLDGRAAVFETAVGVEQPRQPHHRAGDEPWRAAEEVEDERALGFPAADRDAVHVQAQAALAHRGSHRPARRRADDVWTLEPVGIARVDDRVRHDGARERDRKARRRFHLHLRQLFDLRLQHLERHLRGGGRVRPGRVRWDAREQRAAGQRATQRAQFRRQIDQLAPQLVDLVAQARDIGASAGGQRGRGPGSAVERGGRDAAQGALSGAGNGGHGHQRDGNHEGSQTQVGTKNRAGHAAIVVAASSPCPLGR